MKTFTIENETSNITLHATFRKPKPQRTRNSSVTKLRSRSWLQTGPQPAWSRSGTACRARSR